MSTIQLLNDLIGNDESEHLDFKQDFQRSSTCLIHDILCMANSLHSGNRYIIYGVSDDKQKIGITNPKWTQADIVNFLRISNINKSLWNHVKLRNVSENEIEFYILEIEDVPLKPFFLTKTLRSKKDDRVLNPGVVFTRNADSNSSKDGLSPASDDELELMWRQRFALDKPPLDRFYFYLESYESWECISKKSSIEYFYKPFPEFRLQSSPLPRTEALEGMEEGWVPRHWYIQGRNIIMEEEIHMNYFGFLLQKHTLWIGDNGREPIPLPSTKPWQIDIKSPQYKIGKIIAHHGYNMCLDQLIKKTEINLVDE